MKSDLIIFTTVALSSDVVGVFRRNESVAIRGRVRAGGVQKLLDVHHGGGAAAGHARRRGSDGLAVGHRSSRAVNKISRIWRISQYLENCCKRLLYYCFCTKESIETPKIEISLTAL